MNTRNLNPVAEKVMSLLLQNPDAVDDYINSLSKVLTEAHAAVRLAETNLRAAQEIAMLARPRDQGNHLVASQAETVSLRTAVLRKTLVPGEASRRDHVLSAAADLALAYNEVSIEQVQTALQEQGIDLGGIRPGTAIGNILMRDPNWERVGEGKFKPKEATTAS